MNKHFLVIDDSELNLILASSLLTKLGITSDTVSGALEAYERLSETHYDMILIDFLMPDIDGAEATQYIRSMNTNAFPAQYYKNIPIIALSADVSDEERATLLSAGVNRILNKPIQSDLLKATIDELISAGRTGMEIKGIDSSVLEDMLEPDFAEFLELLKLFYEDIPGKQKRIRTSYTSRNYEAYTVEVHKIKGEALIIGASSVADLAKKLEFAGKAYTGVYDNGLSAEDNLSFIRGNTSVLLDKLSELKDNIKPFIESHEEQAQPDSSATDSELKSRILRYTGFALNALEDKDYELAKNWLVEISEVLNCSN